MKNFNMAALPRIRYAVQFLLLTIGLCLVAECHTSYRPRHFLAGSTEE